MDFDATQRTLAEVIRTGDHIIPRYQRDYAWEEENVQDLWDDLRLNGELGYFIGNMVVHSSGPEQWDLVDGQQRLTTILIAIIAIKDAYDKIGEHGRSEGLTEYIQQKNLSGEITFRLRQRKESGYLQLSILSKPEFRILDRKPESGADRSQYAAYILIKKLIDEEISSSSESPTVTIDAIRDRFLRATVVYVRVGDKKNAFRIFETLNDRGRSLRQIDLVKNQIISTIPDNASQEEERVWTEIIRLVETVTWSKVDAEDFLGYFWNSTAKQENDEIVAVARVRRSVERHIQSLPDAESAAREFIKVLHQTASIFKEFDACLSSPNGKHWQDIVPGTRWRKDVFEEIDSALYGCLVPGSNLPLNTLFALLRSYIYPSSSPISKNLLVDFLTAIETLQFRWSISKRPSTSSIRRAYRRAAYAVDKADSMAAYRSAYHTFKMDAEKLMPTDPQFKDGLRGMTYFAQKPADVHRLRRTLEKIEDYWGSSKLPRNQDMTLEHIEPQGGRSINSRQNFWIGKLGNIMLLPGKVNSALPSSFNEKSIELSRWANPQDVVLLQQIERAEWGNSSANDRMEALLDVAVDVWPRKM
ncbi:DUF262 domain-containing HNH endonuclease family protein [Kocuria indica]|uniref:DUF262 domain-containing protein n=1 Tax=Kocuria marina TaxID=223184 RepID=UPI001EF72706|nr:DUF262 domain-containing protein [Kocuria indica]MCG7432877.1 DUF262 domain-containing HNH endonuclease family protein [Kocuria indica]